MVKSHDKNQKLRRWFGLPLLLRLRAVVETQMKEEYSLRDVARTLNISEAAVKSRLYRARRRLSLARVIGRRPTTGQPRPEGKSSALGVM